MQCLFKINPPKTTKRSYENLELRKAGKDRVIIGTGEAFLRSSVPD
jgi:hypothetical protein